MGAWTLSSGEGYQSDIHYSAAGVGNDRASWTFSVTPGVYRVSATWSTLTNRATDAPFTVFDDTIPLATVAVNQELAPGSFVEGGVSWGDLGALYSITGSVLKVELSDLANEFVIADGIRIERVGALAQGPEIQVTDSGGNVADGTATVDFASTPAGVAITKTFTVSNVGTQPLTLVEPITVPAEFTVTSSFGQTPQLPTT